MIYKWIEKENAQASGNALAEDERAEVKASSQVKSRAANGKRNAKRASAYFAKEVK